MQIAVSIPLSAVDEDALLHYAAFEPGVAAELARRIAEQGVDPGATTEGLC